MLHFNNPEIPNEFFSMWLQFRNYRAIYFVVKTTGDVWFQEVWALMNTLQHYLNELNHNKRTINSEIIPKTTLFRRRTTALAIGLW